MSSVAHHIVPATAAAANTTEPKPSSASTRLLTPSTNPIPLLPWSLAKKYSLAHTFAIAAYYYLRSSTLVYADPDPFHTMFVDLVVVSVGQAVFCAVCLPAAGSWSSGSGNGTGKTAGIEGTVAGVGGGSTGVSGAGLGSLKKKHHHLHHGGSGGIGGSWRGRIMPTLLSLILTLTLPPLPLTIIALVLGAPLYPTSSLPTTLLLAMHVSILGFLPLFYTHGVSASAWRDVAAAWLPFDEAGVWAGTVGCLVGGWVGAVPMALDWDREWQKWPCTVLWGVVLGWVVGRLVTGGLRWGVGRRIDLSEREEVASVASQLVSETKGASKDQHQHQLEAKKGN
ncbi:hypothetical protein ABEF95_006064 [Exophiala dermatitidis]